MQKVIVIGGGVGGLSCAHELAERGYEVHVYEARASWGGKARSQPVASTGIGAGALTCLASTGSASTRASTGT
jgi:uncharacterized protein with NAD-binding domain and iron-sulfur cluster